MQAHLFDKYTERARKVMSLARQEAQQYNSEFIGTEHILLGLVNEGGMKEAGITSKDVRREIVRAVRR